ncbi:hypothetical protein BOTNAR_0025g00450 [Botryotinia narcissicola]|uniref:GRF-type domain-containing protein n=1 Tax=Botryotinia narcissicola TaxID=278944 RepID=A0A4Z1JGS8_9HELO|nr:hypothetical protein BOTNAR_0025g00450 [Botryotinia narcissicola]
MYSVFNTPQKRNGATSSKVTPSKVTPSRATPSKAPSFKATPTKVALNGLFSDGNWQCNCNPRLPAVRFQVKKEGANKGRWFYTCQEPKDSSCGFFLWDDKAKGREVGAVLNNTRTEPHTPESRSPVTPSKDKRTLEGHAIASNKRLEDIGKKEDDEFGAWPLTREDEEKVVKTAERTDPGSFPETPRKGKMDGKTATPGSKRKRCEGESNGANMYPTPRTKGTRDEDIFGTPSTSRKRINGGMWDGNERSVLFSPAETPSPMRFKDATMGPPPKLMGSPSKGSTGDPLQNYDMTEDIMNLLKDQHIDDEVSAQLRQMLARHALKISGIVKGRDITRVALKAKDTKIVELQQKITQLEYKHDMDGAIIKRLRAQNAG